MRKIAILLTTILLTGVGLAALAGLVSCENFFKGEDIKREIEEQIAYANARECTLLVKSDDALGSFLSANEKKCKVGYSIQLQFTANAKNYSFEGLEAVSTGGESREDYVRFELCESDEESSTYTISVTLLKAANDIMIRPKCTALPKIVGIKPALSAGGVEQDSVIEVSFNKAMDAESFGDFSCLTISSDGEDLADLFDAPHFYDGNTKIGIVPLCATNNTKLLLEPSKNISYRNITVSFNFTGKEKDTYGLPLEEKTNYTYKINRELSNSLPYIYVDISGSKGKLSPSKGNYKCIKTYIYPLSFDPDLSYEFIRWKILDPETGLELENGNQVTLENPSEQTTNYSLASDMDGERKDVVLFPEVAERPQILSYTPLLYDEGVNKDTTIQVVFDYDMSENSIYYTSQELDELKATVGESNILPPVIINGEEKFYGYKIQRQSSDEYDYFYKNVSLKDNDSGENLNKFFNPPHFDNKRTLSIFALKDENSQSPLGDYLQILVTLEKDFFYKEDNQTVEGKSVCMAGSKKWIYMVNDSVDKDAPVIANETDVKVQLMDTIVNSHDQGTVEIAASESAPCTSSKASVADLQYIRNKKIKLNIKSTDTGSGTSPAFGIVLQKIYDGDYNKVTGDFIDSKTVKYKKVTKTNGIYSDENGIDLGSLFDLQDGIYKMTFEFKDRGGNSLSYPSGKAYYFAVDKTAPDVPAPLMASSSTNSTDYTVYWEDCYDLNLTQVTYGEAGGTMNVSDRIAKGTKSSDVNGIYPEKVYEVKVKFTDYAGNEVEKTVPKFLTGFALSGMPTFTGTNASHADNVFLTTDKIGFYDITATAYYSDGSTADVTSNFSIPYRSSYNSSWTPTFTYEEENEKGKISKKDSITTGTYFIAKKDALTQVPVALSNGNYQFGDYPQNVSTISSYTTNPVYNGWYIGSNGYFYEKCTTWVATQEGNGNMMSNGQRMANNTQYYFRVLPIEWKVLTNSYNGGKLLWPGKNLDRSVYYTSTSTRSINGNTVNPNDYKYSTLRAFLNGKYESGDPQSKTYQGNGFLQRAFTSSAQDLIFEGNVDNSARSTNTQRNANEWSSGNNVFAYGSTKDKVFVLSVQEATNGSYGFNTDPTWAHYGLRMVRTTDYAKAKHVFQSKWTDGKYESNWWLRSPRDINSTQSRIVGGDAKIVHDVSVNNDTVGIVPAIVLNDF